MKKHFYILTVAAMLFALASCTTPGTSTTPDKTTDPAPAPDKAILVFPDKDALCTQGTKVSATQSTITFKWNTAANTDSYDINCKNLLTGEIKTQSTAQLQTDITLNVSTPYEWSVTSKAAKSTTTTTSSSWRFYNAGPGATSYAPYPAEIISPAQNDVVTASKGTVTLIWSGSDVDNDIVGYDVYLGTSAAALAVINSNITATSLSAPIGASGIYYWKVITKDSKGNNSDSGVYTFQAK